jgi:hypothetical protein
MEDRAPQGCDSSADSRAGMARGGFSGCPKTQPEDSVEHKLIAGEKSFPLALKQRHPSHM